MLETNITDTELLDNFRFELQYFLGLIVSTFLTKLNSNIPFEINYAQIVISDLAFFVRLQQLLISQGQIEYQLKNDQGQQAIILSLNYPEKVYHRGLLHPIQVKNVKLVYSENYSESSQHQFTSLYVHLPFLTNDYQTFLTKLYVKYGISYELAKKLGFQFRHYTQGKSMFLQLRVFTGSNQKLSLIISSQAYVHLSQLN
jgi:hypothetical protein